MGGREEQLIATLVLEVKVQLLLLDLGVQWYIRILLLRSLFSVAGPIKPINTIQITAGEVGELSPLRP